jgi:hypothetical protein
LTSGPQVNAVAIAEPIEDEYWSRLIAAAGFGPQSVSVARKTKDPDLYSWDEAMRSEHKVQFLLSADIEIESLVGMDTWEEDLKINAITKIIPSQWVFRVKRTPDGAIKKFKARLILRGDLQE